MKIAIVGCRNIGGFTYKDFCSHMPESITTIISGGAYGIDSYARRFAAENDIPFCEILPDYSNNPGKVAPILRNKKIVDMADFVLAFWDGKSRGTGHVISLCIEKDKAYDIVSIVKPL